MLRTARESLEVTLREVADALNLPNRVIEAMETDDYTNLPAAVFIRGYLRSYARLLDLDEDAVIALYPHGADETVTTEVVVVNPAAEWVRQHPVWVLGSAAGVLVIVIVVLTVWLSANGDTASSGMSGDTPVAAIAGEVHEADAHEADAQEATAPSAAGSTPRQVADARLRDTPAVIERSLTSADTRGAGVDVADDVVDAGAHDDSATPVNATSRPATQASVTRPAARQQTGVPLTGERDRRITAFGDDVLEFQFTEECWVEVKSNTGRSLYSDLNRPGQTLRLTGEGPFRILLGYAPGVRLAFNDEAVALRPHTRNNVANLVLGQ